MEQAACWSKERQENCRNFRSSWRRLDLHWYAAAKMKCTFESSQFQVFDDVFAPDELRHLWSTIQIERYQSIHASGWVKVWRPTDGSPLSTAPVVYGRQSDEAAGLHRAYPSKSGLDAVVRLLLDRKDALAPMVGTEGVDWVALSARIYLYNAGMRLSWHQDQSIYSGSYIFYAHPTWNVLWGGELMVADEACRNADLSNGRMLAGATLSSAAVTPIPQFLENARENEALSAPGLGRYVYPRPNRLVILAPGHPHQINAVHPDAGHHTRCTISGFFHRQPV
jgi:hypothetical protein